MSTSTAYLLNISEIISTSVSAAAIFSADESCGLPPKRKDIAGGPYENKVGGFVVLCSLRWGLLLWRTVDARYAN